MSSISKNNNNSKKLRTNICEFEPNDIKEDIKSPNKNNEKQLKNDELSSFEENIKTIFECKKIIINGIYDHDGMVNFLKDKDECLQKIELNDSIIYDNGRKFEESSTIQNNRDVIDSFFSLESSDCVEDIYESL